MDKDVTTSTHCPWCELHGTGNISTDATSTSIPNTVEKSPTPLKTKKSVRVPVSKIITPTQSHKKRKKLEQHLKAQLLLQP